ncbi:MAG: hypothetical protein M3373_08220 [Gemmatimonadota bacterium]|nr:hypothetical protein [Gemmatimonadota bacterium]
MQSRSGDGPGSSFFPAIIHLGLGETERALDLLEQAAAERNWHLRLLKVEPIFDPVRSDPRFKALLTTVGLGE